MTIPHLRLLLAAVPGLGAAWGVLELTEPPGPGLDPDSLSYLGAGISLARGAGLRVPSANWSSADTTAPLVHFPPGFSVAIAAGIRAGAEPINAARLVEAAAACVTAMALFLAASSVGGLVAALLAVSIACATPAFVQVHGAVLSEPLFLALFACFTCVLATPGDRRETPRALLLGGLAAAAALVRYAGVSLAMALVVDTILASTGSAWRTRVRRVAVAAALPVLALGAWTITRQRASGAETIRDVGLYTRGLGTTLMEGLDTVARWLAPGVTPPLASRFVALGMLTVLALLFSRAVRSPRRGEPAPGEVRLFRAVEMVGLCYVLVVGASRLAADPGIPLDDRLLAPLFLLASLAVGVALGSWWWSICRRSRYGALLLTLGLTGSWIAGASEVSGALIADLRADGGDLASTYWRLSPLVDWVAHARPGLRLYSNWPAVIWFHTGRAAYELPTDLDPGTVAAFREKIAADHGALIGFREATTDVVSPDSLASRAGLVAVARWPEGKVWISSRDTLVAGSIGGGAPVTPARRIRQ
jgi:hypothetical protein